jgi:hypothetical protein
LLDGRHEMVVTCTLKFPQHVSNIETQTLIYRHCFFLSWSVNYVLLRNFPIFMFANKIAGASVAFYWLASAEFAKSLTLKAVIPFLQRLLQWLGTRDLRQNQCVRLWWRQHYGSILDMYDRCLILYPNIFLKVPTRYGDCSQ